MLKSAHEAVRQENVFLRSSLDLTRKELQQQRELLRVTQQGCAEILRALEKASPGK